MKRNIGRGAGSALRKTPRYAPQPFNNPMKKYGEEAARTIYKTFNPVVNTAKKGMISGLKAYTNATDTMADKLRPLIPASANPKPRFNRRRK